MPTRAAYAGGGYEVANSALAAGSGEMLVEAALRTVLREVTGLLVVHRPSTVALADRVALLQDGALAAVGTHHELMARVPAYAAVLSATADEEQAAS